MRIQEVCILSIPRSGTNYISSVLWSLPAHWCFYELFNPLASFGVESFIDDLSTSLQTEIGSIRSQALIDYAHRHPVALLDHLSALVAKSGMRSFSYKVFPNHLEATALKQVLRRRGLKVIQVERHPIDVFISRQKVEKTRSWSGNSTTKIAVELDFEDFLRWRKSASSWFRSAEAVLHEIGERPFKLRYEVDALGSPEHLLRLVHRSVLENTEPGTALSVRPGSLIQKQDKATSYSQKVSNWNAFCTAAREMDALDTLFVY